MSARPSETSTTVEDVIRRVRPAVRAERAYHVGTAPDVRVKLNQNESPFDVPEALKRELVDAFLDIPFNRYPAEQPDALAAAIAGREGHPADGVLVGNGSNELAYTLGLALVESGTRVVLPRPMFSLYGTMVRIHGGTAVEVGPLPDLRFDVAGIVAAIERHEPALTIVATPNNPTGLAVPIADIDRVLSAGPGLVLVDEAYVEFNPHGTALALLDRHPNLVVMRTLSKAFGLAGLRVGYVMARPELVRELVKARLPFMIDRLAQAAAHALLARPDLVSARIDAIRRGTAELSRALAGTDGIEVLPTTTNFVLFRRTRPGPSLLEGLKRHGVLVRDMGGYPELAGFLRVSAGTPDENRDFMLALEAVLDADGRVDSPLS